MVKTVAFMLVVLFPGRETIVIDSPSLDFCQVQAAALKVNLVDTKSGTLPEAYCVPIEMYQLDEERPTEQSY